MKKLAILGGIAVVLLLVVLFVPKPEERISAPTSKMLADVFPEVRDDELTKITMDYKGNSVEFLHKEKGWVLAGDPQYPADERALQQIIESLGHMQVDRIVSESAEKQDLFEVSEMMGAHVSFFREGDKELLSVVVGKSGPDMKSSYVRAKNGTKIYVADAALRGFFERKPDQWRDRTFSRIKPEDVHQIRMEKGKDVVAIERDVAEAGAWKIAEPAGYKLGPNTVTECENTARQLASMVATELPPPGPDSQYGFDKPYGVVTVTEFNGGKTIFTFGKQNEKKQIYARRSDSEGVYLIQSWMADRLLPGITGLQAQAAE